MASIVFFCDFGPQVAMCSARAASTAAMSVGSVIKAVRVTIARTSGSWMTPAANSAATSGGRSCSMTAR
jgi:hypothetical protein